MKKDELQNTIDRLEAARRARQHYLKLPGNRLVHIATELPKLYARLAKRNAMRAAGGGPNAQQVKR